MKLLDLTGKRYGRLVVIEKAESRTTPNGTERTMWRCKCDCGNEVIRSSQNLRKTPFPSCGCLKKELTSKRKLDDLVGKRFGRLTVLRRASNSGVSTRWECKCDCGKTCIVLSENLKTGHTTSCGCYREEVRPNLALRHGMKGTRIYAVWEKMIGRCESKSNPSYPRYGGRGIRVCAEWRNHPESFIKWAYDNGYRDDAEYGRTTIERVDNSKGYCPKNCKIANAKEQANNRRSNRLITHNGETKTLAQWRDHFGISQSKAYYHLVEKNRSIQELIDKGII